DMEADASHTIGLENWPRGSVPVNLTYFGGLMKDDPHEPVGPDPAYPPTQREIVRREAIKFLDAHAGIYWPDAVTDKGFRWEWLVDLHTPDSAGPDRFESQFYKANIDPSRALRPVGRQQHAVPARGWRIRGFTTCISRAIGSRPA